MSWERITRFFARGLAEARRQEVEGHLDDTIEAGHAVRASDTGSIAALAVRSKVERAARSFPLWLAGLPVAILVLFSYGTVYEAHFFPWDMMEDTESTATFARWLRVLADWAWVGLLPLGLGSGYRVAQRIRDQQWIMSAAYVGGLFVLISQSSLFAERNEWYATSGLRPEAVDQVSPYSVVMFTLVLLLPTIFLVADWITHRGTTVSNEEASLSELEPPAEREQIDGTAVAAVMLPLMMFVIPMLWVAPFLIVLWLSPVFSRRLKALASITSVLPVAMFALWFWIVGDNDGDGAGTVFALIAALGVQLAVWVRLAMVAFAPLRGKRLHFVLPDQSRV